MIARELIKVHSSNNLKEDGIRGRERMKMKYPGITDKRESTESNGCSVY